MQWPVLISGFFDAWLLRRYDQLHQSCASACAFTASEMAIQAAPWIAFRLTESNRSAESPSPIQRCLRQRLGHPNG